MWRTGSARGRAPGKCSKCGWPTKNHNGPYGPRCRNEPRSSTTGPSHHGSYIENREEEIRRRVEMEEKEKQTREEEANGGDGEHEEDGQQEEAEEDVQVVEEEQEPDQQEEEESVQESLKGLLKELHKEVGELRVQVKDIAVRQESIERSDKQARAPINSTRDASDMNWRTNEHEHECMSMPRLMRVAQSSPAEQEDYERGQYGRDRGQGARPVRVPGLRPVIAGDDLSRYCPVLGVPEKTLKAALTGEYVLIESLIESTTAMPM